MRVDEHTIEIDGSPVFYRSADSPAPCTPLYLHGLPTSSEDWLAFLERTGGIAPDLIGFGRSAKGGHLDYSIEGLAGSVERLLTALNVETVRLVGHDWGAAVALELARRRPELAERAALIDPLPVVGGEAVEGFRWHRLARLWRRPLIGELAMGATTRWLLARWLRRAGNLPNEQIRAVWEQFDQGTQRAILRLHRSAGMAVPSSGAPGAAVPSRDAPNPEIPTLVIWGEDDPWFPTALGPAYAKKLPDATLERVPYARHWPWLDDPSVIDRVADFLG